MDVTQPIWLSGSAEKGHYSTVKDNLQLSEPQEPGTSKLDWRYFEHNKFDRNELQVLKNLHKGTGTKMAEKLNNFEKFEKIERKKKSNFSPICTVVEDVGCQPPSS